MSLPNESAIEDERYLARVERTLAAAAIPPSKLGPTRGARLDASERDLYFWILRRFASHGRPSRAELAAESTRRGSDLPSALRTFAREDLVHVDSDGEIAVAYPFSGRPTAHRVRFPSGNEVEAMCAIDALGIAPMFGETIKIESRDPASGETVGARVRPVGASEWWPVSAVVVAGALRSQGDDACCGCCPVLNFWPNRAS